MKWPISTLQYNQISVLPERCSRVSPICRSWACPTTRSQFFLSGVVRGSLQDSHTDPGQQPEAQLCPAQAAHNKCYCPDSGPLEICKTATVILVSVLAIGDIGLPNVTGLVIGVAVIVPVWCGVVAVAILVCMRYKRGKAQSLCTGDDEKATPAESSC